ncbi:MAG: coproporphyrinogen dehydrogenase HemZ [Huintestinicola sp.]|uniref:coproporphyrinogen dehydrogenase HemZ n=1 Tax=Huintestinicola sp. TaxID=2981661 RepID=UPI003F0B3AD3
MTIYFENNSYKYEVEAVMKLFCPLESFEFVFDGEYDDSGDSLLVSVSDKLLVSAKLGEKKQTVSAPLCPESERELTLCRMIYTVMSQLTGVSPEWGCLTGIRPVKKVNALISEGCDKDGVYERLREKYFISRRKSDLSYLTAVTQSPALQSLDPKSFSLYVAIPFCPSRCSYCSFVSHSIRSKGAKELIPQYVEMLCREIEEMGEMLRDKKTFCDTVYIGGGTPTSLSAEQIEKIMKTIEKSIDISRIREYTVEAGRADSITEDKLIAIRDNGATRISINPQTMQDGVLKAIGRQHTAAQFEECYTLARRLGFDNINTDTIAGLPTDTFEGFKDTIDRLIELDPESITVHTLTVKRSAELFKSAESFREGYLTDDSVSRMVNYAFDTLTEKGFMPYYLYRQKNTVGNLENVGYAKQGKEGLYNIFIMEEAQNILACGASGSTKLIDPETGKITRYFNYKYPYEYISRYEKMMGYKTSLEKFLADM